ncbi:MAG: type III pantothenate kinase [Firmicutes bacterium]|nr:type III pantothenate kinase [Bacillota bacterium]
MILAIDIGNTNIKVGVFDGDTMVDALRLSSESRKTGDEYGRSLVDLLVSKGVSPQMINGIIMCSVNPDLNYTFNHLCNFYFKQTPMLVGPGLKCGLNIKYDNPHELGADRLVASVAGASLYGAPCIVIDYGTATTFNVVSAKKEFLGGAICPGIKTGAESLVQSAAKLPRIELTRPKDIVGRTTITNMQSGIINGYIGLTSHMVSEIKKEIGSDAKVVATGGLSGLIASGKSDLIDVVDRALTLRGLNLIYKLNKK